MVLPAGMSVPEAHGEPAPSPIVQASVSTGIDSTRFTCETVNAFGFVIVIVPPTENMSLVAFVTSTFQVTAPVAPSFRSKLALLAPFTVLEIVQVLSWIQCGAAVF